MNVIKYEVKNKLCILCGAKMHVARMKDYVDYWQCDNCDYQEELIQKEELLYNDLVN